MHTKRAWTVGVLLQMLEDVEETPAVCVRNIIALNFEEAAEMGLLAVQEMPEVRKDITKQLSKKGLTLADVDLGNLRVISVTETGPAIV